MKPNARTGIKPKTILLATHASYWKGSKTNGVVDSLSLVLTDLGFDVALVDYPLEAPLHRHILNALSLMLRAAAMRPAMIVGADPINGFVAVLARMMRLSRVGIYYTVDYADERFGSRILNVIYHGLDNVCCRFSDSVWNVSSRIVQVRLAKHPRRASRMLFVPNNPLRPATDQPKSFSGSFVLVSSMRETVDWPLVLGAFHRVLLKCPNATLHLIGDGPDIALIKRLSADLDISGSIVMHGHLSQPSMLAVLSECSVALAVYREDKPWTKYGDSTKAREAMALGLPVIITHNTSTSQDIANASAGIVIDASSEDLFQAMLRFSLEPGFMRNASYNALRLSAAYNMYCSLEPYLTKVFQ